jgi:hypothetical protein
MKKVKAFKLDSWDIEQLASKKCLRAAGSKPVNCLQRNKEATGEWPNVKEKPCIVCQCKERMKP